jgi:hypothetical protein
MDRNSMRPGLFAHDGCFEWIGFSKVPPAITRLPDSGDVVDVYTQLEHGTTVSLSLATDSLPDPDEPSFAADSALALADSFLFSTSGVVRTETESEASQSIGPAARSRNP